MSPDLSDNQTAGPIAIVYVIDNFYRGAGTENQLAILIDHIDRSRFKPYVFNLRPKLPDWNIEIDCDVFYLNVTSVFSWMGLKAIRKIRKFIKEHDVGLVQVYYLDSKMIGVTAARLAGLKKIISCRRNMGWWHTSIKVFFNRLFSGMSRYCLVNAYTIRDMIKRTEPFDDEHIEVIYNGVELRANPRAKEKKPADFGIPDGAPVVGLVSNMRPVKRIDRFIRAAAMVENREAHFLIVGEKFLRHQLEKQAAATDIAERIHFHHAADGVSYILRLFDIGVLTSESEGLSNVLIEYALAGIPALAFDVGGNREIISDGETGFVIPDGNESRLAGLIDQLLDDPGLRLKLGQNALRSAQGKFGVERMIRETEKFYEKILRQ